MRKLNPQNERLKRTYCRFLRQAKGKSEHTADAARKALDRYELYTGARGFESFNREQAIGFKDRLASTNRIGTQEQLSHSTQTATLAALKEFFAWLAWQPGYKSKIHVPDIEYLNPSRKDTAIAKAAKLRDFPSLEQIRAAISAMPSDSVVARRNRALIAFGILTGIRDRAMASLSLQHLDPLKSPPVVRQEPDRVATKFSKAIVTYFFPLGDDLASIVCEWVSELRLVHLFGPNDPIFPRTKVIHGNNREFHAAGIEPWHWSDAAPIRSIFRDAFLAANLPYYPPHTFRHSLVHLMQSLPLTPEQIKAWSQNLGHESVGTTLTAYGRIDPHRQGEVIRSISIDPSEPSEQVLAKIRALLNQP